MTMMFFGKTKFRIGALLITDGATRNLTLFDITKALYRHGSCDGGEADSETRKSNRAALKRGGSASSIYTSTHGIKFWIVTNWNRSTTTISLPHEDDATIFNNPFVPDCDD